jgi:hypothetical protein
MVVMARSNHDAPLARWAGEQAVAPYAMPKYSSATPNQPRTRSHQTTSPPRRTARTTAMNTSASTEQTIA